VYRLPTDAEWEYACRAGTKTPFHFGQSLSPTQAQFHSSLRRPTRVGSFPPNAWGLHDMHGNVWEWCSDWWGQVGTRSVKDPRGPSSGKNRVVRSGSWNYQVNYCRSAYRGLYPPDGRYDHVGIRVVCDAEKLVGVPKKKLPRQITNSVGMRLVLIPAGKFVMGSPADEKGRFPNERQREVEITKPFYMGVHEVTQKQYREVTGNNPSFFSKQGKGQDRVKAQDTDSFPVENVTWQQAVDFCKKLSDLPAEKKAGRVYRLPTEAEWEYACRAGSTTAFHQGASLNPNQANFGHGIERTCKVGSYRANAWGLHDMHGNVAEWCADWFRPGYSRGSPTKDPKGPSSGNHRVIRGGGWVAPEGRCRAAVRFGGSPDLRQPQVGFRVVCEIVPAKP
jgi:formylglycine-generating enzyme required for sulfatase activity